MAARVHNTLTRSEKRIIKDELAAKLRVSLIREDIRFLRQKMTRVEASLERRMVKLETWEDRHAELMVFAGEVRRENRITVAEVEAWAMNNYESDEPPDDTSHVAPVRNTEGRIIDVIVTPIVKPLPIANGHSSSSSSGGNTKDTSPSTVIDSETSDSVTDTVVIDSETVIDWQPHRV